MLGCIGKWIIGITVAVLFGSLWFVVGNSFANGAWNFWEFMRNWIIWYIVLEIILMVLRAVVTVGDKLNKY